MKTIGVSYLPSMSHNDAGVFSRSAPTRSAIKRRARRVERRAAAADLRNNLQGYVDEGIEAFKRSLRQNKVAPTPAAQAVVAAPAVMRALTEEVSVIRSQAYASDVAKIIPFPAKARDITVIRKRPFHRPTVETLRLAA